VTALPARVRVALALVVGLGACAGKDAGPGRAPASESGEHASATKQAKQDSNDETRPGTLATGRPAHSELAVAVVNLEPDQSQSCEQMCGRVGDCLVDEDTHSSAEAGHLELGCLDLCLNTDPESEAGASFRSCGGSESSCGPLLDCARSSWAGAEQARLDRGRDVATIAIKEMEPCRRVCGTLLSCMNYGEIQPDRQDREFELQLEQCAKDCKGEAQSWEGMVSCTQVNSCTEMWECLQQARY
jgi:hypothetical protein